MSRQAELAELGRVFGTSALSNRNLIINGAMQVWQRGTSRTFKQHDYGTVDRFQPGRYQEAAYERVAVSSSEPDALYALRVSSSSTSEAASGTRMAVGQMVESVNCQQVKGRQVTLSFWIKFSNATFTGYGDFFRYEIFEYTGFNPSFGTDLTNTASTSLIANGSLPTSWTKYTKTITVDSTTNTIAVRMGTDNLGNTTNNSDLYYDITEVQLEVGDTATPFEHRSYGQELALCQRYCEVNSGYMGAFISYKMGGPTFAVEKRTIPSLTFYSGSSLTGTVGAVLENNATGTTKSITSSGATTSSITLIVASYSGDTNMSFSFLADAEL